MRVAAGASPRPGRPAPAAPPRAGRRARRPPATANAVADLRPTRRRGFSEAYGSWKTICSRRSQRGRARRRSAWTGCRRRSPRRPTAAPGRRRRGPGWTCRSPTRRRGRPPRRRPTARSTPTTACTGGRRPLVADAEPCAVQVLIGPPPAPQGRRGRRAGRRRPGAISQQRGHRRPAGLAGVRATRVEGAPGRTALGRRAAVAADRPQVAARSAGRAGRRAAARVGMRGRGRAARRPARSRRPGRRT